jgi:hypothetical protein
MEKLNNDNTNETLDSLKYDNTTCPLCMKSRFYLKFYCGKTILYCQDCSYWEEI